MSFAWRMDGLLASRAWSSGPATLVYGYDRAKRPASECNGTAGACPDTGAQIVVKRTYDRAGNVTSESQNFGTTSQAGEQDYTYDAANRVLTDTLGTITKTYTYDDDGNRTSVKVGSTITDTFTFDVTDETKSDAHGTTTTFVYDRYGNLTSQRTSAFSSTSYAYDIADRLVSITQADGSVIGFTFNAAGHHATRTSGGATIDTYWYLGASDVVALDTPSSGPAVKAVIDAMGDRLASCTDSAGSAWIIADLHGNVAGQTNLSGSSFIDVFRYDAYGGAIGSSGGASTVPSPWRFQGRIVESTAGSTAYDFDARSYVPDLGTFTSLDTVAGSAQNPLTLNRFLYANANPATLVDPDGHMARMIYDRDESIDDKQDDQNAQDDQSEWAYQHHLSKTGTVTSGNGHAGDGRPVAPPPIWPLKVNIGPQCSGFGGAVHCDGSKIGMPLLPDFVGVQPTQTVTETKAVCDPSPDGENCYWDTITVDLYAKDTTINVTATPLERNIDGVSASLPYGITVTADKDDGLSGQVELPFDLGSVGFGGKTGYVETPDKKFGGLGADTQLIYAKAFETELGGHKAQVEVTDTHHSMFLPSAQWYAKSTIVGGVVVVVVDITAWALSPNDPVEQCLEGGCVP